MSDNQLFLLGKKGDIEASRSCFFFKKILIYVQNILRLHFYFFLERFCPQVTATLVVVSGMKDYPLKASGSGNDGNLVPLFQ